MQLTLSVDTQAARAAKVDSATLDWCSTQEFPKIPVVSNNNDLRIIETCGVPSMEFLIVEELVSLSSKSYDRF